MMIEVSNFSRVKDMLYMYPLWSRKDREEEWIIGLDLVFYPVKKKKIDRDTQADIKTLKSCFNAFSWKNEEKIALWRVYMLNKKFKGRGTLRPKNAPSPLKIQFKHIQTINLTQSKQFFVKLDNSRTYPIYF